jgi:hypothetical protein
MMSAGEQSGTKNALAFSFVSARSASRFKSNGNAGWVDAIDGKDSSNKREHRETHSLFSVSTFQSTQPIK